ncbi:hypothetical protein TcCL_NonESM10424, partial [Trypanosoma cruzi]
TVPPRAFDSRGRGCTHNFPTHFHGRATAGQHSYVIGQFWSDHISLTPRIRPPDLRIQKKFPFQMKWIWISLNLTSPLGSREFGMEASLEFYSKSGAHAITGTVGTLTLKLPLTFLVSWMRVAVTSGTQQAVYGLGQDYTAGLPDADCD